MTRDLTHLYVGINIKISRLFFDNDDDKAINLKVFRLFWIIVMIIVMMNNNRVKRPGTAMSD